MLLLTKVQVVRGRIFLYIVNLYTFDFFFFGHTKYTKG